MARQRNWRKRQRQRRLKQLTIVLAVVLLGVILFASLSSRVSMELKGQENVQLSYGEKWEPEGVNVQVSKGLLQEFLASHVRVNVDNQVDLTKPGTYQVHYSAKLLLFVKKLEQTVTVTDNKAPVITLKGGTSVLVPLGQAYQEEGYTAVDDVDGDITDQVVRTETESKITYTVTDSSGNKTEVVRTIFFEDTQAPVITLLGEEKIQIKTGDVFEDPGFTASDNLDGDLTAQVTVEGSVYSGMGGTYTLTYTVSDAAGNKTTVTRTVEVVSPKPNPDDKVIYLTFDDGPGPYTEELLGILKKYDVKATFFVVNTKYLDILPKIVEDGHSIAVHTLTHDYSKMYTSEDAYFSDLYAMQQIIKDYTGITTTMLRFPGGSSNAGSKQYCKGIMTRLTKAVREAGFQYYDWSVDSGDAVGAKTPDEVYNNVIKGIGSKKQVIILQHDIKQYSVQAVERIIQWGQANGYTFLPLQPDGFTVQHATLNN